MSEHTADYDAGRLAEAQGFICPDCLRIGGRWGVVDDQWVLDGDHLICAACAVLPPAKPDRGQR